MKQIPILENSLLNSNYGICIETYLVDIRAIEYRDYLHLCNRWALCRRQKLGSNEHWSLLYLVADLISLCKNTRKKCDRKKKLCIWTEQWNEEKTCVNSAKTVLVFFCWIPLQSNFIHWLWILSFCIMQNLWNDRNMFKIATKSEDKQSCISQQIHQQWRELIRVRDIGFTWKKNERIRWKMRQTNVSSFALSGSC